MDEAWERAVEAAKGDEDPGTTRSLTLDGALKCAQGRLPPASLFETFTQLRHLSIANVGLSSLTDFPTLPHLEQLILSDNRIAGGLEHLVKAGLKSLRDLDLSNNKIQSLEDLAPLSQLRLVSLDLYECQVTRLPDYRARVFQMMKTLQYLDKTDSNNNERPESDDEEEDESEDEDVDDANGDGIEVEGEEGVEGDSKGGVVTLQDDDDEEGEEDEERDDNEDDDEDEGASYQEAVPAPGRNALGQYNHDNGSDEEEVEDDEEAEENVEVQDIDESEDGDAGEDDEDEEEEGTEQASGALVSTEGELDVQENEEDENGELGEDEEDDAEEFGVDNDEDEDDGDEEDEEDEEEDDEEQEDEYGTEYLVQPIGQAEDDEGASDFEPGDDDEEEDDDFDVDDDDEEEETIKAEAATKRKRSREDDIDKKDVRPPKH